MLSPLSIIIVTVLSALMGTAVLGSLRSTSIPGVRSWFWASVMASVALTLASFQGHGPGVLTVMASNAVLAYAYLAVLQGCRQFFGVMPVRRIEYAAYAALMAGLVHWYYVRPDTNVRIVLTSLFCAYVFLSVSWLVHRRRPADRPRYVYLFVTIVTALGGIGHLVRVVVYAGGWAVQDKLLEPTLVSIAFLGLGILALPSLSIGMVMLVHDRLARKLEQQANVDELTGTMVRRAFLEQAAIALKAARRSGRPLSVAILDIDHFKSINDVYGHAGGDQMLTHFAAMATKNLRAGDILGRLGGEEFAVLCPDTDKEQAAVMLNRLRAVVATQPCPMHGQQVTVTVSAGVEQYRQGETLAALMARADEALYVAKRAGRNRVVVAAGGESAGSRPAIAA